MVNTPRVDHQCAGHDALSLYKSSNFRKSSGRRQVILWEWTVHNECAGGTTGIGKKLPQEMELYSGEGGAEKNTMGAWHGMATL